MRKEMIKEMQKGKEMDNKIVCSVCAMAFELSEDEKVFYEKMRFIHAPRRCRICRGAENALKSAVKPERIMYNAICDKCGEETQLPFKPTGDKPVYCRACFAARNKE